MGDAHIASHSENVAMTEEFISTLKAPEKWEGNAASNSLNASQLAQRKNFIVQLLQVEHSPTLSADSKALNSLTQSLLNEWGETDQ